MGTTADAGFITNLCKQALENNKIYPELYDSLDVKRGLRNADGTGVMAGFTRIGNVQGYVIVDGERSPMEGKLIYRSYNVENLVSSYIKEEKYGFDEVAYLLLFGDLPTSYQYESFRKLLSSHMCLPDNFTEDVILKTPSRNIMNKLANAVLALYTYDDNAESLSIENIIRQSIELIARIPTIVAHAFAVKRHYFDKDSLYLHRSRGELSIAENFLQLIRPNMRYDEEEAKLLDLCLVLHAEHGGGNNSAFACRVLSSAGTDTYSAISAAIGSLKGPKHGGANNQVMTMFDDIKKNVSDWSSESQLKEHLKKLLNKEAGDGSGLIYGMGHAIYTLSDPRAVMLKNSARRLAGKKGFMDEFKLLELVEKLTPGVFAEVRNDTKPLCANVDLYSGLVYQMLNIPRELFTPLFAISRIAGWCAHRVEEVAYGGRIIRPAYKAVGESKKYVPISER